jgi:hypothetical protein
VLAYEGARIGFTIEWRIDTPLSGNDRNCQPQTAEKGHRVGNLLPSGLPKIVVLIENKVLICLMGRGLQPAPTGA